MPTFETACVRETHLPSLCAQTCLCLCMCFCVCMMLSVCFPPNCLPPPRRDLRTMAKPFSSTRAQAPSVSQRIATADSLVRACSHLLRVCSSTVTSATSTVSSWPRAWDLPVKTAALCRCTATATEEHSPILVHPICLSLQVRRHLLHPPHRRLL